MVSSEKLSDDWRVRGQSTRLGEGFTFWRREGAADRPRVIPAEHIARVRGLLPAHVHCPIDAEHNLLLTHPDVVVVAVPRWMRG